MKMAFVSYTLLPTLELDSWKDGLAEMSEADYFAREARAMAADRRVTFARRLASIFALVVPARLRARWREAHDDQALQEALLRLAETSPHLLADIGMEAAVVGTPVVQMDQSPDVMMVPSAEPASTARQTRAKASPSHSCARRPRLLASVLAH